MYALEISNLQKRYSTGLYALKGIDLVVKQKDFFALLGPNGAGKTTTIGILTSLVRKTAGTVKIFGYDIDQDFISAKSKIGVVPQEFNFNIFEKIIDIVIGQAGFYGIPRKTALAKAEFYLKELDLWQKRNEIARNLSGGMKRRLMIARALVHDPEMLILDEPTTGIDIELRRSTWKFLQDLNKAGTTIILTTHYLEEAEHLCNGIAIIDHGLIKEKTTIKELLKNLNIQTFILDLIQPVQQIPTIANCNINKIDDLTLEVIISKDMAINQVFANLTQNNIKVASLKNKTNRLEELFLNLVDSRKNN